MAWIPRMTEETISLATTSKMKIKKKKERTLVVALNLAL